MASELQLTIMSYERRSRLYGLLDLLRWVYLLDNAMNLQ
jgi:hypothetical protein